jgi:aldehyde dehydrogenase (NAD+)
MTITNTEINLEKIHKIFEAQKSYQYTVAESNARERSVKLQRLSESVLRHRDAIKTALYKDYKRHPAEVDLAEIYPITTKIKHTRRNLSKWMAPSHVKTPLSLLGSSSWIHYEPKGVCLIIAPWNYPIQLALGPLISAVAAGNTAIIKPSEMTPHSSAVLRQIVEDVFDENEVAVIEGAIDTSTALLELPFNHIFFTGAPEIGKIVMAAASRHLASVTLELGGKSPTIVDETADINLASARITWVKYSNNGQICIAPDYILVHKSKMEAFTEAVKRRIKEYYGDNAAESDSYMRIVNQRHFLRISAYLEDSVKAGAKILYGGQTDPENCYIAPTVITDVPLDAPLMQNEIFGPIMPIIPYNDLQEVIDIIRSKEKPLALYIYSKSKQNIERIMNATRAGGTCINHNATHFYNPDLPFGGSNNSGIGKSNGKFGFLDFSNERAVYKQILPSALDRLAPPYNDFKMKLIDFTIKWF